MDAEQRRQVALENLRQQNNLALDDHRSANQRQEIAIQGDEQRKSQESSARWQDWGDARSNDRRTSSTIKIDKVRNALDIAKVQVQARLEEAQRNNDTQRQIQLQGALRQMESGDIKDVVASGDGRYYGVTKGGQRIDLGITAPDKQLYSGGAGAGGLLAELGQDAPQASAPAPAAAPPAKRDSGRAPMTPRVNNRGVPSFASDTEADAFVNNPANKGKSFIGPDGKRRIVP
ncbi:hypothetical protein [Novosphingobium sp. NBM11]|uniref:hypothetical protein n=1 Tax=Novosphingobium sp. NBM11 TaxID=2596914 RepID=UPI0018922185|nr:hypothetical protein [Novosphingobium sp. NBM11]